MDYLEHITVREQSLPILGSGCDGAWTVAFR